MAAPSTRYLMMSRQPAQPLLIASRAVALAGLIAVAPLEAQTLYKYQDAAGHWVYSDRGPEVVVSDQGGVAADAGVRLTEELSADGELALVAVNDLDAWAQIAYRVESSRNLDPDATGIGNALLPPKSETHLMLLVSMDKAKPAEGSFSYQYIIGHPGARHRPESPYRLPYSVDDAYRVTQAYPDRFTHATVANRFAIDFEMPVGTRVFAARAGIVVEVVDDRVGAGLDPERDADQANFVRVLHDDGTLALYGHLDAGSVLVAPGQRVGRGEGIASSGNNGFSSGPHLHFVVQRNRAGALESVPVRFAGDGGAVVTPATGDWPVAF